MWKLKCGQREYEHDTSTWESYESLGLLVCLVSSAFLCSPPAELHNVWGLESHSRGGWQQLGTTRRRGSERSERVWSSLGRSVPSWPVEFIWIHTVGEWGGWGGWGTKTDAYLLAFIWSAPEGKQELEHTQHPGPPREPGAQEVWQDPFWTCIKPGLFVWPESAQTGNAYLSQQKPQSICQKDTYMSDGIRWAKCENHAPGSRHQNQTSGINQGWSVDSSA